VDEPPRLHLGLEEVDTVPVSTEEHGSVELVEDYGPAWSPGRFELGTDGPRVIMAGVDGSRSALRAGAFAGGLARRQHSRLVVVYVAAASAWTAVAPGAFAAAQEETFDELVDELRTQIRGRADELGIPVTLMVRRGDAFVELRNVATELQVDMVVVGASEHAEHRFVGSIATRLVRTARWPVVVVP
jgi:nucleotide-binding universal stress UspA family protein